MKTFVVLTSFKLKYSYQLVDNSEAGDVADNDEENQQLVVGSEGGPKKKLTNQFNFCERAALTHNNPSRVIYLPFTL